MHTAPTTRCPRQPLRTARFFLAGCAVCLIASHHAALASPRLCIHDEPTQYCDVPHPFARQASHTSHSVESFVDFDSRRSALLFRRIEGLPLQRLPSALGSAHRHNFDVVLTESTNGALILFDGQGHRHLFAVDSLAHTSTNSDQALTVYRAATPENGTLQRIGNTTRWFPRSGWQWTFEGSRLHRLQHPSGHQLDLTHDQGLLIQVQDQYQDRLLFHYNGRHLQRVEMRRHDEPSRHSAHIIHVTTASSHPDCPIPSVHEQTNGADTADGNTVAGADPSGRSCNTESTPPPLSFQLDSGRPGVVRLDIRPASCRSFFIDFLGTQRGQQIELGFEEHPRYRHQQATVRSFPVVDFIHEGHATALISRDLTLPTYALPDALFDRLVRDGAAINARFLQPLQENGSVSVTELGVTTTISRESLQSITLELVLQHGVTTAEQRDQIERARQHLADRWGIRLVVIEIP